MPYSPPFPPEYCIAIQEACEILGGNHVGSALASGSATALCFIPNGSELYIPQGIWLDTRARDLIERGHLTSNMGRELSIYWGKEDITIYVFRSILRNNEQSARPDLSEYEESNNDFLPFFLELMLEAVDEFDISEETYPKKEELEEWFINKKLPDGSPVSVRLAEAMATLCRPPEAMKGGNKRV